MTDAKYRLARVPWWVRGVVSGLFFGGVMFAYIRLRDDRTGSLPFDLALAASAAVMFAVWLTLVLRAQERRIFRADDGTLSSDERVRLMQTVDAGRWPQEPRLQPAASRLVEQRLGRSERPAYQLALYGVMLALAGFNAVTNGSWWWCAVAFWLVAGPWSMLASTRRRRSARALRDRVAA